MTRKHFTIQELRDQYFNEVDSYVSLLSDNDDEDLFFNADDYAAFVGDFLVGLGVITHKERKQQIKRISSAAEAAHAE
jgi:uncharacterized protein YgfB (UPF0149 family)